METLELEKIKTLNDLTPEMLEKDEYKERVWLDTDILAYTHQFDDWDDWHEPDEEKPIEDSSEWWNTLADWRDLDVEDFWGNLKYSKWIGKPCVIIGHLGLWWGNPEIYPDIESDIEDAIHKCLDNSSIDDARIWTEGGSLFVNALHHDGCNSYEIRVFTPEGYDKHCDYESSWGDEDQIDIDYSDKSLYQPIDYLY